MTLWEEFKADWKVLSVLLSVAIGFFLMAIFLWRASP